LFFDLAIDHTNDYYLTVVIDSTNELTKDTQREEEREAWREGVELL